MTGDESREQGAEAGQAGSAEAAEAAEHGHPNYMAVWLGLFILTVAEVGVAFISHLPKSVIVLILLGLAVWKALLVALYFMHLRFEPNRLRLLVVAPLPLPVIMVVAILMEYV